MGEKTDYVKKNLTRRMVSGGRRLVYSKANLQRKGSWLNTIQFHILAYEYLYRNGFEIDPLEIKEQFQKLRVKPKLLIRSGDIRDKNDLNRAKAIAALFNLSPHGHTYNYENLLNCRFKVLEPQPSKSKIHRKVLSNSKMVIDLKKTFLTDASYAEFIGFFIGFLIPEMRKRHISYSYDVGYDFKASPALSFGFWYLTDLPQLLTSSLFATSLYDYYDWSNSTLQHSIQFPILMKEYVEDESTDDEGDCPINNNVNLDYYTLFLNYFKIL